MSGAWLTEDETELVLAAISGGDEAARHWDRFTLMYEFEDIWDGDRYSMLPSIHIALRGIDGVAHGPRLAGIHRRTWVGNTTGLLQAGEVIGQLQAAGITACLHGDLAVAATLYADLAGRVAAHGEVLVTVEQAERAVDTLAGFGWRSVDSRSTPAQIEHSEGTTLVRDERDRLRVAWETCGGVAAAEVDRATVPDVLARSIRLPEDRGGLAATPPDVLVLHALCAGVGSHVDHRLRSLADGARVLGSTNQGGDEPFDLDAVVDRAGDLGVGTVVAHTVRSVSEVSGIDDNGLAARLAALAVARVDRRRHERLISSADRSGRANRLRAEWTRRSMGLGRLGAARTAPEFLRTRWGLTSMAGLPVAAVRRLVRRVPPPRSATRTPRRG